MIDSLTIISKGGLILYQHIVDSSPEATAKQLQQINHFIATTLLDPTKSSQVRSINKGTVAEWKDSANFFVVILYPEVLLRKSVVWLSLLLDSVAKEYQLFDTSTDEVLPDATLFDKTFRILWKQATKQKDMGSAANLQELESRSDEPQRKNISRNKGKEKRHWGEAKVTKQAMAELDFSKDPTDAEDADDSRALLEARAAYLPSSEESPDWEDEEVLNDDDGDDGWGSSLKGLMSQMAGNKVLTEKDLEQPLHNMQQQLTSKNVASDIAAEICSNVKSKLVGKRMQSFSRIKTAVRQALETAISKILAPEKARAVDPLKGVITKRDGGLFGGRGKRPFVISFIGINGVGKVRRTVC